MVANSLPELEIAIKSKLKLEQSEKIRLSFKRKGKLIVLDDLEFLKEGMTVKVSIISQLKPNPGFSFFPYHFLFFLEINNTNKTKR